MRAILLAALLALAVTSANATTYAVLDNAGTVQNVLGMDDDQVPSPCPYTEQWPDCTIVPLASVASDKLGAWTPPAPVETPAAPGSTIIITSTATPALNGTYAVDTAHQAQINAVASYILSTTTPGQSPGTGATFPTGDVTLPWPDASGVPHTFPSPTEFIAFAQAAARYVTLFQLGQNPSSAVGIP